MGMSISEAFELYRVEHIVYLSQSSRTEEMNALAMKSLIKFCGDIDIKDLTFDVIRKWKDDLSKRCSDNTVRGYILKIRVVLKHARLKGYDVLNYEMVGVPKRENKIVEFLTKEEVSILIDSAFAPKAGYSRVKRYRNRAIISLLYASGIRNSELCSLNRNQILENDDTFSVMGKGNKPRVCFLDERAREHINEYLELRDDNEPALFISELNGKRVNPGSIQMILRNVAKKSGINKQIHPHTLRHSYATNMLKNNANLLYVSKFLGHKSIQTTEMYTHVVDEDLRREHKLRHTI